MPEQSASRKAKGCVKLRRCSKFKTYYKAQTFQTDKNKRRKLRKHIRSNPGDLQAIHAHEQVLNFGAVRDIGLTQRGKELEKRYSHV